MAAMGLGARQGLGIKPVGEGGKRWGILQPDLLRAQPRLLHLPSFLPSFTPDRDGARSYPATPDHQTRPFLHRLSCRHLAGTQSLKWHLRARNDLARFMPIFRWDLQSS